MPASGGSEVLRIGLIGAGAIGRGHLATFRYIEGIRVAGVADPVIERAWELAALAGAKAHTDYRALIGDVDAIWICTPPRLHLEQTLAFTDTRAHVFCEKPIALDLDDADRMIAATRRAGVHLMIGQVIRYYPETIVLKQLIDAGELGEPVFAFGRRLFMTPPAQWTDWRRDARRSGGFAVDSGVHEVDTVRFLAGEVASVFARIAYRAPEQPGIDTDFRALLALTNGAAATIEASCMAPLREWAWGVVGTRATALSPQRGQVRVAHLGQSEERLIHVEPVVDPQRLVDRAMLAENQAFIDAIRADRTPPIPGEEGRRNLAVILAALQSAREERVIRL
jgi:UDP-N-acetylglucosamine 3-dehydrogenase